MSADAVDSQRRAELQSALTEVRGRIAAACRSARRSTDEVTLIAVTKTWPASDVAALVQLGVRDVGESRDQEAVAKVAEVGQLLAGDEAVHDVRWHFVGQLQSRKCRSVAAYAAAVHSVDRIGLAGKLATGLERAGRESLEVFVQVNLEADPGSDPGRGGVSLTGLDELADDVAAHETLRLRGLMAVPPIGVDPEVAFAQLAELSQRVRAQHPQAGAISAGMSVDLDAAVHNGSTYVRVGSALLGRRPPIFG